MLRSRSVSSRLASLAVVLAAAVALPKLAAAQDASSFDDIVQHFKYGSIGAEERLGVPYWIWRVLPEVFADKLPERPGRGYERLGFLYEEGNTLGRPIGTSYRTGQVDRIGFNCATCHVGTWRAEPGGQRHLVVGMPANQMDLQAYARFLAACAGDPRFNASTLIAAIQKMNPDFGFFESLVYRFFVIRATRNAILEGAAENAWFDARPPQGPGRVDTFNPYKVLLGLPMQDDKTIGTADLPSLWNQRVRQGLWLHWDGNNDRVEERNKSAAIGAGATPDSLDLPSMTRIEDWILDLKPPAFPAERIDQTRAAEGAEIYARECAACHELDGARIGQVTEIGDISTDRHRLDSFTAELAKRMNTIGEGHPWRFSHFRKTNGYSNMPLDGLWLRAPYLHNGSVPTLRALLFTEERPIRFHRAHDVYDWTNVGFVSSGPEAERDGVLFDTTLPGNGNGGHLYGAELPAAEKEALLEYLKTK